jgi:cysteine-rich repeat protein
VQNPAQNPWIGATDDANDTDAIFDWVTDETFVFSHFAPGQPDDDVAFGGNGECLHLVNASSEWNDTNCTINTFVSGRICEFALQTCGDNIVQASKGETCDDGNTTNGDGCSATCLVEAVCGNGLVEGTELCDDGNTLNGDGCSSSCVAEDFVTFSFTGAAGHEPAVAADTTPATLAAAPTMTRGPGIAPSAAGNTFSAINWSLAGLDATDYFSFTVTPATGLVMNLFVLELDERRSGTGIRNWSIRSSLDGFTTDLATFAVPNDTATRTDQRLLLGPAFRGLTTAVEFRIYGFNSGAAGGTWRIDNVQLGGAAQ